MTLDPDGFVPALEYEGLRRRSLCGEDRTALAGYRLLLHRGMLAWMRASPVELAPAALPAPGTGVILTPGVEAELVQVLSALILSRNEFSQTVRADQCLVR